MLKVRKHAKFDNVFVSGRQEQTRIYTLNLDRGRTVYDERLFDVGNKQYRQWNPFRSKLCASIMLNARKIYLKTGTRLLYLGASSGTTVSHCSDIVTKSGAIYAVEFSARSLRELVQNCADRPNVIPIFADANRPSEYAKFISGPVDVIIQDVAQPNQTEILIKNVRRYLTPRKGQFIYEIKARSIDTIADPKDIFQQEKEKLERAGLQITDSVNIGSFQKDHQVLFGRYLGEAATE